MIPLVEFLSTISRKVKKDLLEFGKVVGKEVIDTTATRKGIVMDIVKDYYGIKVSLLGFKYKPEELRRLKRVKEDTLVCIGQQGRFFVPMSKIKAIGNFVLLSVKVRTPELKTMERKREEIFRMYRDVRQKLRKFLPEFLSMQYEERKGWLDRIMGE